MNVTLLKLGRACLIFALIFWAVETGFFLIRDGWHYYAEVQAEKTCDEIVKTFFCAGLWTSAIGAVLTVIKPHTS